MTSPVQVAVNPRFRGQSVTGVQRYAAQISAELERRDDVALVPWSMPGGTLSSRLREVTGVGSPAGAVRLSLCNWSPVVRQRRSVVVVHDLLPNEQPDSYSRAYRTAWNTQLAALRAGSSTVVTVSERSRRALERVLRRPVVVAPNGVTAAPDPVPGLELPVPRGEAGFALFVGAHDPRKNAAFARRLLPALERLGLGLVITRRSASAAHAGSVDHEPTPASLSVVEDPDDSVLWALYREARVLLHPSIAEGFGLPLLEAGSVGTPAISSPVGAAEDVLGDDLVVGLDLADWEKKVSEVLQERDAWSRHVRDRAASYTWSDSAATIAAICQDAAS